MTIPDLEPIERVPTAHETEHDLDPWDVIEAHTVPEGCAWPLADDLTMRDASAFIDELKKLEPVTNERRSTMRADA